MKVSKIYYNYYTSNKYDPIVSKFVIATSNYIDPSDSIRKDLSKLSKSVLCLIQNFVRMLHEGTDKATISLDKNGFSTAPIINGVEVKQHKLSYQYTRSFIDYLIHEGYIDLTIGYKVVGLFGIVDRADSTITLTVKIKDLLERYKDFNGWKYPELQSVVILKDTKGKPVTFKVTPKLKKVIEMMVKYNETCKDRVVVDGETLDVFFYKVFNGNFNKGGRSYDASVQQLSQEIRKTIKIDGQDVVELDFSAHHPRILYSLKGIDIDKSLIKNFDPYYTNFVNSSGAIRKEVVRKLAKVMLLLMINTDSEEQCQHAFGKKIFEDKQRMERGEKSKFGFKSVEELPVRVNAKALMGSLQDENNFISDYFYKAGALKLQNIDSKISDFIIDVFNSAGKVILCIHDSYIVAKQDEHLLKKTMVAAYNEILGMPQNCKIDKK